MRKKKNRGALFRILLIFIGLSLLFPSDSTFQRATVSRVVDGDTIKVQIDGQDYKVRLIGVDTPETVHPSKPVEFFGKEASSFTKKELTGRTVYLQKDVSDTDRYNRLLRYVRLERPKTDEPTKKEVTDLMFNAKLVKEGYANSATFPPDVKYQELFQDLERQARAENKGLRNKEAEVAFNGEKSQDNKEKTEAPEKQDRVEEKDTGKEEVKESPGKSKNENPSQEWEKKTAEVTVGGNTYTADITQGPIKGNKNSKIYHTPGQQGYDKISVNNCIRFETEEEAQKAGYRPAQR